MIVKQSYKTWKKDTLHKISSFCKKSPLSIEMNLLPDSVELRVNDEHTHVYNWDFDQDPKEFVSVIKQSLLKYYPRVTQNIYKERMLTPAEKVDLLTQGKTLAELSGPFRDVDISIKWRIDKIMSWNQTVILVSEPEDGKPIESIKYKYNGSIILYLNKYRRHLFKDNDEASEVFFKNANMITSLTLSKELQEVEKLN